MTDNKPHLFQKESHPTLEIIIKYKKISFIARFKNAFKYSSFAFFYAFRERHVESCNFKEIKDLIPYGVVGLSKSKNYSPTFDIEWEK